MFALYRWDSADPERAPPPLPLNPGSPATRSNASATVRAAAAALQEKAEKSNENTPSSYTTNPMPLRSSPEKSLIKGPYHKRMQSLQNTTNNREYASYLDRRSPEKASRAGIFDKENQPNDRNATRVAPSTPPGRESPNHRISDHFLTKPILGENTPPSATMLALQNMRIPIDLDTPSKDPKPKPLANINTNLSREPDLSKEPDSFDGLSAQIISLTGIATSLQQEMAQLSRRSKDNATDLVSLKAATNARDEDIRKSLKELTTNLCSKRLDDEASSRGGTPYLHPATGAFMIDNKAHESPPSSRKSFPLPNMPSPNSFAASLERDLTASPGTMATDGSASIALLEKVLREMATKEGQETLLKLMEEVKARPSEKDSDSKMPKMLEEILNLVKENSDNRALIRSRGDIGSRGLPGQTDDAELEFDGEQPNDSRGTVTRPTPQRSSSEHDKSTAIQPASILTDEVLNTLQRVKHSVTEGGGLTNEVKALVRELRGEVLGMGRELARKLQEIEARRSEDDHVPPGPGKEEIAQIVEGALAELRNHMEDIIQESHHRSSSEISRATVDSEEIYTVVSKALSEIPLLHEPAQKDLDPGIKRDEILDAVREAWETYKPEIELQNFGLERDEILECLSEGLKDYQPQKEPVEPETIYQHVLDAVHHALQDFTPPRVEPEPSTSPEEVVAAVRDCLESFEWPVPPTMPEREEAINRDDVLSAVREGLAIQDRGVKEADINREDIFEAVRVGFHDASNSMTNGLGDQVVEHLHGMVIELKDEFKQYSAANGGDTEQILDALKDGLEVLRGEIESYVDRAADVTGKDEIIHTFKDGFQSLQLDVEKCISDFAHDQPSDTVELLDAMEKEFEHLRQTMSSLLIRNNVSSDKDEILDAIRDITEGGNLIKDKPDVSQSIKEELEHLRETLSLAIVRPDSGPDTEEIIVAVRHQLEALFDDYVRRKDGNESVLSSTSELLDAFHDGIELLRSDMDKLLHKEQQPIDTHQNEELLQSLKDGLAGVTAEISRIHDHQTESVETSRGRELTLAGDSSIGGDIETLKALVTQLQIKVDAIDVNHAPPETEPSVARKDDIAEVLEALKEMQGSVAEARSRGIKEDEDETEGDGAKKKDVEMLEMLLQEMKTQLDELCPSVNANWVTAERVETIETLAKEMKESLTGVAAYVDSDGPSKADVTSLETVMKDIWVIVEELKSSQGSAEEDSEKVVKGDVQNLEALIFDIKAQIEELVLPDVEKMPTKDDITNLTHYVTEFREKIEAENELTAQAFEARKVEHGGLAEKVEDVKTFIFGIKDELKSKLTEGEGNLVELKTMLEVLNGSAESFAKVDNVKEIADLVKRESERLAGDREASRMEGEERAAALFSKMDENQTVIMADLSTKIDDKFNEVLSKYEDSQVVAEEKFTAAEERDMHNLDTLMNTKTLAEDLKMLIAGMGDSVTEACERMSDDAKTFFGRVDESFGKVDELQSDVKTNNEDMKSQFDKALAATDRLESQIAQSHPEILSSVKDILAIVGQHYEYSRKSAEELKSDLSALPSAIPPLLPALPAPPSPSLPEEPPVEKYDDSLVHDKLDTLIEQAASTEKSMAEIEKLDYLQEQIGLIKDATTASGKSDAQMEKLQQIEEQISLIKDATTATERSDAQMKKLDQIEEQINVIKDAAAAEKSDAQMEKLHQIQEQINVMNSSITTDKSDAQMDKLREIQEQISQINDARAIAKPDPQMEKLDLIQEQIKITAREVNEIMASQSRMVMEGYEDKKQEALDTAIALERRLAQKEKVESEIVALNGEKEETFQAVQVLKQEREELTRQNFKLTKEVGGMETALRIRQEEVRLMEDRAEDLERRIVEGVLDHARSQILNRPMNPDPMSLKRVPSSASTATRKTAGSTTKESSILGSGVGVALKRRTPLRPNNASNATSNMGNARRILSHSHVTGKRGADRQSTPLTGSGGLTNLKRSHSVKSNYGFRKSSWEPRSLAANKENEVFPEEEEEEAEETGRMSEAESDTGTERRTSYTGTLDDNMSYVTGSVLSTDRMTSYSSINAQVAGAEPSQDVQSQADTEDAREESDNERSMLSAEREEGSVNDYDETGTHLSLDDESEVAFYPHSDSGLGTDLNSTLSEKPSAAT